MTPATFINNYESYSVCDQQQRFYWFIITVPNDDDDNNGNGNDDTGVVTRLNSVQQLHPHLFAG